MPYDYSDAPPPRKPDLIPDTVASVLMRIRAGNAGEDGMLTRSKDGLSAYLDCELTLTEGEYAKRKFWFKFFLEGTTDGHAQMIDTHRRMLKAVLDSAFGLQPNDMSPEARAARTKSLKELDGISFVARIGTERGKPKKDGTGDWDDKNTLAGVITPDRKEWHPSEQPPPFNGGGSGAAASAAPPSSAPIARPGWAS
jgi:hypothetical protein